MELRSDACLAILSQSKDAPSVSFRSYHTDSREVTPGGLFFALRGKKHDGHLFLSEVAKLGAVGAVVERSYQGPDFGLALFFVDDVTNTLQKLAQSTIGSAFIIAVTGSVGKTTTKELVAQLLSYKFKVSKSEKNQNSQTGLPLTLLNRKGGEEILVLEMGMSRPGELSQLVQLAPPDLAVITKIDLVHAENFPQGEEAIFQEKAKIFSHPKTVKGIYPFKWKGALQKSGLATFSSTEHLADFYVEEGCLCHLGVRIVASPFQESHFTEDFFLAASVATLMGMKPEEILAASSNLQLPQMRFERIEKEGALWILDSYNACYSSMRAALVSLPHAKRKIAVLGEIRELGTFSEDVHQRVGEVAAEHVDLLLALGEGARGYLEPFKTLDKPALFFESKEQLEAYLRKEVTPGDLILVKGSKALAMWTLLGHKGP